MLEGTFGNPVILSSVGARLLINMKEAGEKGLNEGMGSSAASRDTVSGMDFAAPHAHRSIASRADGEEVVEDIESVEA